MASWIGACLPQLEQQAAYDSIYPATGSVGSGQVVRLDFAVCPSGGHEELVKGPNNYVASCGRQDVNVSSVANRCLPLDWAANGAFHNLAFVREGCTRNNFHQFVSPGDIAKWDGTSNTLLISENVTFANAAWTDTNEVSAGFLWQGFKNDVKPIWRINGGDRDFRIYQLSSADNAPDANFARPSSNHPGLVIAAFADGSVERLNEAIDYLTYVHLITPRGGQALRPGTDKVQQIDFPPEVRTTVLDKDKLDF
jgi:prepilin-type processing-associated H-X9-DG protein